MSGHGFKKMLLSLIRVFGPRGNPQAHNLFGMSGYLQKQAGIELQAAPASRL